LRPLFAFFGKPLSHSGAICRTSERLCVPHRSKGTKEVPLSPLHEVPEAELIASAVNGDPESFGELYRRHSRRIYYLCYRMVNDTDLADDLTQEAFVHAFRRLSTFRQESRFTTWMHRIAVNTVLMFIRKRNSSIRECPLDPSFGNEEDAPFEGQTFGKSDDTLSMTTDRVALQRAIEDLPPGYRLMLILHDIHGYEHQEIAEIFGCTTGNTKSQLHKARLRLRSAIARDQEDFAKPKKKAVHPAARKVASMPTRDQSAL
jgi:RNA polymerase sigma-70 factor (ECF subfamily)